MLQILGELLPFLIKINSQETKDKLIKESGIIEECIMNADSDSNIDDNLVRAQSISLLSEIWSLDPALI